MKKKGEDLPDGWRTKQSHIRESVENHITTLNTGDVLATINDKTTDK